MHKDDSSGNVNLGTVNFCLMMVENKSEVLGILRDPNVVRCIFLRPDDAGPRAAAKKCDKGLRHPEDMSCEMVRGRRQGILWVGERELCFNLFNGLEGGHLLLIFLCLHS